VSKNLGAVTFQMLDELQPGRRVGDELCQPTFGECPMPQSFDASRSLTARAAPVS
jgi:hypothetical protein